MRDWFARHWLGLALLCCGMLHFATPAIRRERSLDAAIEVKAEGSFRPGGEYPGAPFLARGLVRSWGSWSGSDEHTGSLTLGPFSAPERFRLGVGGYPRSAGIEIYVERIADGQRRPVSTPGDVRERWKITEFSPPAEWIGQPVRIVALDAARQRLGWVALTEPLRSEVWSDFGALCEALAAWGWQGLLLGAGYCGAARWFARRRWLAPQWIPLGAGAIVALAGWVAFWIHLVDPLAGKVFSIAVIVAGVLALRRPGDPRREVPPDAEEKAASRVPALMFAVGFFYLLLLYLFPTWLDPLELPAHRFRPGLPGDNAIPHQFAARLFAGEDPRATASDWLSSDRPPLQSGWLLLTWSVTRALGFEAQVASLSGGIWFQLWWVAAAHGLLRALGMAPARARAWIGLMALSGFFLQNTVFTWPKLAAGAFACGAFGLWFMPGRPLRRSDFVIGGVWAGLAWVSHGGVAFSFLAMAPWVAWRAWRGEWRGWLIAAAAFSIFAAPWAAYQRLYDPPGNRLVKWHLAGQIAIDQRGAWQTLKDRYGALPWNEIWRQKVSNFATQVQPAAWQSLFRTSAASLEGRQQDEFFFFSRALTWWPLAIIAVAIGLLRRRGPPLAAAHAALAGWIAATMVVWCSLMFGVNNAVIHQGSYTTLLGAFVLCSAWFEASGRGWLPVIALLQGFTFLTTWAVGNHAVNGTPAGWPGAVAAVVLLAALTWPRSNAGLKPAPG